MSLRRTLVTALGSAALVLATAVPAAAAEPPPEGQRGVTAHGVAWRALPSGRNTFAEPVRLYADGRVAGNTSTFLVGSTLWPQPWVYRDGVERRLDTVLDAPAVPNAMAEVQATGTSRTIAGAVASGDSPAVYRWTPVRWVGGRAVPLGGPDPGNDRPVVAANNRGDVLLRREAGAAGQSLTLVPSRGAPIAVHTGAPGAVVLAHGMNDRREVVVTEWSEGARVHGVWRGGALRRLPIDPGAETYFAHIGNGGWLAWHEWRPDGTRGPVRLHRDGRTVTLPDRGHSASLGGPEAVNRWGVVAGSLQAPGAAQRPVVWVGGVPVELGTPAPGAGARAITTNRGGDVLVATDDGRGFVWRRGRWLALPAPPGWSPQSVLSINDAGTVVGTVGWTGDFNQAERRTVIWTLPRA